MNPIYAEDDKGRRKSISQEEAMKIFEEHMKKAEEGGFEPRLMTVYEGGEEVERTEVIRELRKALNKLAKEVKLKLDKVELALRRDRDEQRQAHDRFVEEYGAEIVVSPRGVLYAPKKPKPIQEKVKVGRSAGATLIEDENVMHKPAPPSYSKTWSLFPQRTKEEK